VHRFYLPEADNQGSELVLSGSEARHALSVLRLRKGASVIVLDGHGHEFHCELTEHDRRVARLKVVQRIAVDRVPVRITLVQGILKNRTMEIVVQKSTELGAEAIVPIQCDRSVSQIDGEDSVSKARKWSLTAVEAIKQCGQTWLPLIEPPTGLEAYFSHRDPTPDLVLLASLHEGARHPRSIIEAYVARHGGIPRSVEVWVGPEGDFTPHEMQAVIGRGGLPISLGPLVLRAETAALYCLSVLAYEFQTRACGNETGVLNQVEMP
jgi:16S rRNA (uracil1498-N3)-methyltransferase